LHERLEERRLKPKRYGLTLQPQAVVVGPVENPSQFLLVLDNYHWELNSPLQAVDSAFKVYMALNAHYPAEARHLWTFVQKAVYGINTRADHKYTDVERLVHEYKQYVM